MEKIKDFFIDLAIWILFPIMLLGMEILYRTGNLEDWY